MFRARFLSRSLQIPRRLLHIGGQKKKVEYAPNSRVVMLQYDDLVKGVDLSDSITTAYGPDGLGLLCIKGVPKLPEYRATLLPLAQKFANLPENIKQRYVDEKSQYQFGWSHGKEKFAGLPDFLKGSYYANPVHDDPFAGQPEVLAKYPTFASPNIWPRTDLPAFEPAFKNMAGLMVQVGALLAKHLDHYVHSRVPTYPKDMLHRIITTSRTHKARLLHYFPRGPDAMSDEQIHKQLAGQLREEDIASWCGWHNDHGSLTALCPNMFMTPQGESIPNPEPRSGLYIRSRKGELIQATLPADCMGFQVGDTQQVHSGGLMQATPHAVLAASGRGPSAGISRETLAVFMEPEWDHHMSVPKGVDPAKVLEGSGITGLPKGVPPLSARWNNKMTFGEFTDASLAAYTVN